MGSHGCKSPPPLPFSVGISQSPVIFTRDTGGGGGGGGGESWEVESVDQPNTFDHDGSLNLNCKTSLKLVEKTYATAQHTNNMLHLLLRFHRILFMKSRKYSCARKRLNRNTSYTTFTCDFSTFLNCGRISGLCIFCNRDRIA